MTSSNQTIINDFFANQWLKLPPNTPMVVSSPAVISKRIHPDEWVLDVGCGKNPFKQYIKNLVGIDPVFNEADVKTTIEEYQPDRLFDVATCLGSINFGNEENITAQIKKIIKCLKSKSRIYWRLNPVKIEIPFQTYGWTFEKLQEFADQFGFMQCNQQVDGGRRLYAEWHR